MSDNDKADIRKITGTVEDAVAYPILTRDVTSQPSDRTSVSGPSNGSSLDSIAQSTIRQLLGWRYRADDTTGFLAALTKTIQLKEVEDHIEWTVQPQNYMVQADLGQITGAQASIYARAQVALNQSLPLLNGLTLLGVSVADPEDMEATRAIIQTEFTTLVNELAWPDGPRVQRVDSLFSQLLGPTPIAAIPPDNPAPGTSQLATLAYRFGLSRTNVNTIEDEQDFTNYLILYDYIYSLYQTWKNQRIYFTGKGPEPYLGTQLVLISQALDALEESVQEAYDAMDSVFFGASDRQATELHFFHQPLITVADLFSWVETFATSEGLQLVQEGGKDGVLAFRSILNQIKFLMYLATKDSSAHSNNPVHGFHTARVQRALQNIANFIDLTEREANKIQRINTPVLSLRITGVEQPSGAASLELTGDNIAQTGASVFLIDREDLKQGFDGTLAPDTTKPNPGGTDFLVNFPSSPPPPGRYIVVVQNPDRQYAWSEVTIDTTTPLTVRLPLLRGEPAATAEAELDFLGFTNHTRQTQPSKTVPSGQVIRTDPPGGTKMPQSAQQMTQVTLFVSK